jgi:hypothetical protein
MTSATARNLLASIAARVFARVAFFTTRMNAFFHNQKTSDTIIDGSGEVKIPTGRVSRFE